MRQTHIYSVEEFGSFERCNRDTQKKWKCFTTIGHKNIINDSVLYSAFRAAFCHKVILIVAAINLMLFNQIFESA